MMQCGSSFKNKRLTQRRRSNNLKDKGQKIVFFSNVERILQTLAIDNFKLLTERFPEIAENTDMVANFQYESLKEYKKQLDKENNGGK